MSIILSAGSGDLQPSEGASSGKSLYPFPEHSLLRFLSVFLHQTEGKSQPGVFKPSAHIRMEKTHEK